MTTKKGPGRADEGARNDRTPVADRGADGGTGLDADSRRDDQATLAVRSAVGYRYDILDPEFLHAMALIAAYGADKYGEGNWMLSRLEKDADPINHIYKHLGDYQVDADFDHPEVGNERKYHLAAIAFNAMMEFYYESHTEVYGE